MISDFENVPQLPAIMGPARQIAYMVDDIDAAMTEWHGRHGVGPFLVTRNVRHFEDCSVPVLNPFA